MRGSLCDILIIKDILKAQLKLIRYKGTSDCDNEPTINEKL